MAAIDEALTVHRGGDVARAESLYREILKADDRNFDALHMLGIICAQRGNFSEAEHLLRSAVAIDHSVPPCLHNYGIVLSKTGQHEGAIVVFNDALVLAPHYVPVYSDRGNAQLALGRPQEALDSYDRGIALEPRYPPAHYNRGIVLERLQRYAEALASYDRALALEPRYALAASNRASVLVKLGRYQDAVASCDRALAIVPDLAQAHSDRGAALAGLNRYPEARASCDRALALDPGYSQAYSNRAYVLEKLKYYPEALEDCDRALALDPQFVPAYCNRGVVLNKLNRFAEALDSFDQALALDPGLAPLHCNRGVALRHMNRLDEAIASYKTALSLEPNSGDAHFNLGELLLLTGDFACGLPEYEWRAKTSAAGPMGRYFSQPLWLGAQPVEGKVILLHSEQGLGDTIQFSRYVPLVASRGARVVLEVQRTLVDLVHDLPGAWQIVARGERLPPFDMHCPLPSLPLASTTLLETIPADVPYLRASASHVDKWRRSLERAASAEAKLKVGLCWAGNPNLANDHMRSVDLRSLLPLFSCPDVQVFSLQKELREGDRELLADHPQIVHLGDQLDTFADTAAIISLLDVVVSVDTVIAHLAGALGARTWVLLPYVPEWRWLMGRENSPWYPTMRLFRQPRLNDWPGAVTAVKDALSELSRSGGIKPD
jgi:tetratricopeptide (TPR) repeat protein